MQIYYTIMILKYWKIHDFEQIFVIIESAEESKFKGGR